MLLIGNSGNKQSCVINLSVSVVKQSVKIRCNVQHRLREINARSSLMSAGVWAEAIRYNRPTLSERLHGGHRHQVEHIW